MPADGPDVTGATCSSDLPDPAPPHPPTLANIQGLRALASLMVIFVHLQRLFGSMGARNADTEMFTAGVDLFFVISGFIMVYTTRQDPPSPGVFLRNRIARLVPIYWVFTVLIFVVALLAPGLFGGTVATPLDLVRSLLFIPYNRPDGLMRPLLFVGWSLNLEMMFYVLFALSLALPWVARREVALVALLLGLVLWNGAAADRMGPVVAFLTQPLILEFAVGMLVGVALPSLPRSRVAGTAAVAMAPVALAALLWFSRFPLQLVIPATALPATGLLLAALIAERGGLRLDHPWILELGAASYALYLTHPFVTQALTMVAVTTGFTTAWTAAPLIAIAIVLSVGVAVVVHRRVERPLGRRARRFLLGPSARRRSHPGASVE